MDGGPSTSEQKVYALRPRTAYALRAWVKILTEDTEARLGVKQHGADEHFAPADSSGRQYQQLKLEFTTGDSMTAIIYCSLPNKTGAAVFDDISIETSGR